MVYLNSSKKETTKKIDNFKSCRKEANNAG